MKEYDHKKIEEKWQKEWEKKKIFKAEDGSKKPKFYGLIEFPYPSGEGLHVGHVRSNTAMDAICRKRRMEGFNVLYPIGWDAFGLPTENYAIKTGIHPIAVTKKNTDTFRRQLKSLGFSFDWSREIDTTDPEYYKWTQWIFLQLFKRGLAYKKKMPINWCPSCKIGLANEEVVDGKCERCGTQTEKRNKEQWMLAITKYADRLDKDLDSVDFLEKIKIQQRNWIGKSNGSLIKFSILRQAQDKAGQSGARREDFQISNNSKISDENKLGEVEVFTTRPDTLFGVTYIVLAPESDYVKSLSDKILNKEEVLRYIEKSKKKSEIERTDTEKEKTGIKLDGVVAVNPANGEPVPVYIADYVLADYGTGAVMAVPAHDERDFAFAKKYNLEIRQVISSERKEELAYIGQGKLFNSGKFDGMDSEEAKWKITEAVEGRKVATYKLRDWIFSRQHYWGEPIPMVYCEGCANKKYNFVFIHGFRGSPKYGWMPWLKAELEKRGHSVFAPDLPNADTPSVEEQADFIIQNARTDKDTILIGHSLGGAVLLRVLEKIENKIAKAVFVDSVLRPRFNDKERSPIINAHNWKFDFEKIRKSADGFTVLADANYEVIPKEQLDELAKNLDAYYITSIPEDGHFCGEKEPEVLRLFENLGWIPVPEKDLPVELPKVEKYQPTDTGESPLAGISEWVNTKCPHCGGVARRETDTMPNWAGSSWYYLAYLFGKKGFETPVSIENWKLKIKNYEYFMPVDWYNGGMEHTTLHLLYSRFWHKFLFDAGLVPTAEPYQKRTSHGMVLAEGGVKMSKSKGNVINPDEIAEKFGADSLRLYEMFMGPFDQAIAWSTDGLVGARRFAEKVWRIGQKVATAGGKPGKAEDGQMLEGLVHKTIKKVGEDIENMRFNTAISALMICANEMDGERTVPKEIFGMYLKALSPFAPHLAEELWSAIGGKNLVAEEAWPAYDPAKVADKETVIIVQVNGKVRGQFTAPVGISEEEAVMKAKSLPEVGKWLGSGEIRKAIFAKGKIVSFVV